MSTEHLMELTAKLKELLPPKTHVVVSYQLSDFGRGDSMVGYISAMLKKTRERVNFSFAISDDIDDIVNDYVGIYKGYADNEEE